MGMAATPDGKVYVFGGTNYAGARRRCASPRAARELLCGREGGSARLGVWTGGFTSGARRALSARPGDGGRTERRWMGDCPSQLSESAVRVGIAQDRAAAAVRAA